MEVVGELVGELVIESGEGLEIRKGGGGGVGGRR